MYGSNNAIIDPRFCLTYLELHIHVEKEKEISEVAKSSSRDIRYIRLMQRLISNYLSYGFSYATINILNASFPIDAYYTIARYELPPNPIRRPLLRFRCDAR